VDGNEVRAVIERFHEAFNRHDLAELALIWHPDCAFEDTAPPDGVRHVGRDAVLAACARFFDESPAARFEMEELITAGDRAVVRWRYSWGDGHVRGIDFLRVADGQLAESLAYVKG
jgi:ketosteroid isomerase-like protein